MYTWGYIKESTLMKLDMTQEAAIQMGLMNKFPYFANEALTQICSIKPKKTSAHFKVRHRERLIHELAIKYGESYHNILASLDSPEYQFNDIQIEYKKYTMMHTDVQMPKDFISYSSQPTILVRPNGCIDTAYDTDYITRDYNTLFFLSEGDYNISYNARWFLFTPATDDRETLNMPSDIVDSIPMYIASQCLKIDDEQKAMIMRNEFELALARLDTTQFVQSGTFKIDGGW